MILLNRHRDCVRPLFTRNPSTGVDYLMGEFLQNAQGEDVVAGIRTPVTLSKMHDIGPAWVQTHAELVALSDHLEQTYKDMVDIEFTVQRGKLYVLQSRTGKRSARAAFKIATDQVKEGLIDRKSAIGRLTVEQFKVVRRPSIDPGFKVKPDLTGLPASVIMANKWFDPYASFKDYVEKEHGMHYRRAMYWIEIYNDLVAAGVPWEKVKSIGWSKLKEIAGVVNNDNVDEWVDIATKQNTISLIETVKAYKAKDAPAGIEDQTAKTVTAKTFKVHEDQKVTIETAIAKAKEMSSTTADTVALEYICLDFLGGPSLVQKLQQMGIEAALNALEKAYPNAKIDVEITETEAAA